MASSEYWRIGASCVNVSNFVSGKLQYNGVSDHNYVTWKEQMLCLIESEGLLGFINGAEVADQSQDYAVWRRSDRLVKGWILGALSDEIAQLCVRSETARDVWLKLETKFTQPVDEEDYDEYSELYKAALRDDWVTARGILEQNPEAVKARSDSTLETAIHFAVGREKAVNFLSNLLKEKWSSDEVLALEDRLGRNALHTAAVMGNTAAARDLVYRLRALLYVQDHKGLLPVHLAARYGHRETLEFLMSNTKENLEVDPQADASGVLPLCANRYADASGVLLLCFVIDADFYDIALRLVQKYPYLARMKDDKSNSWALERISFKELAFPSGARLSFWESLVYNRISLDWGSEGSDQSSDVEDPRTSLICEYGTWHKLVQHFQSVIERLVPSSLTRIRNLKRMHWQAKQLVICLCQNMASLKENEARSLYSSAMMRAARLGIYEVVYVILMAFPRAVDTRRDGYDLFQVAAANRSDYVFKLIYWTNDRRHLCSDMTDSRGNTILHLVARLAPPHKLNHVPGAALQMQRELQWFKKVKKLLHPYARELLNDDGKTAKMVFTEEHKNLKAEGERWIKDTATSCIIAAALIASVAFAAAITVPGANNSSTGYPMFAKSTAFTIFAISDIICLFASVTSLLVFLSIMTTRYTEEDFLTFLPYILLINLCVNFLSIFCLMITFSASVYLVLGQERAWAMILVSALGCIPLISFVLLNVPLVMGVFYSTFGPELIQLG